MKAVDKRANELNNEYIAKARQVDTRFHATAPGDVGPVQAKLAEYGTVRPLVFGWFGEVNAAFEQLLSLAAETGAARLWTDMRATCAGSAKGTLMWSLRRSLSVTIVRANARLVMDRLPFVVDGSAEPDRAYGRRRDAERRFFRGGAVAASAAVPG